MVIWKIFGRNVLLFRLDYYMGIGLLLLLDFEFDLDRVFVFLI